METVYYCNRCGEVCETSFCKKCSRSNMVITVHVSEYDT